MKLADTIPTRFEAQATGGKVAGDWLPVDVQPTKGAANWSGTSGPNPRATLRLRTDDGPIVLDRKP